MLRFAFAFLFLTIATGLAAFQGPSEGPSGFAMLAQFLFVVFSALLLIFLVASLVDQAEHPRE